MPLGRSASWTRLRIPAGEKMFTATADVEAYFFMLGIPSHIGRCFCLPAVPHSLVTALKPELASRLDPGRPIYPHFAVCPMGFSWGFYFALAVHLEMLKRSAAISPG